MKQLTLRLPEDLHARLKADAERNHRSMHAQILHLVDLGLGEERGAAPVEKSDARS